MQVQLVASGLQLLHHYVELEVSIRRDPDAIHCGRAIAELRKVFEP